MRSRRLARRYTDRMTVKEAEKEEMKQENRSIYSIYMDPNDG